MSWFCLTSTSIGPTGPGRILHHCAPQALARTRTRTRTRSRRCGRAFEHRGEGTNLPCFWFWIRGCFDAGLRLRPRLRLWARRMAALLFKRMRFRAMRSGLGGWVLVTPRCWTWTVIPDAICVPRIYAYTHPRTQEFTRCHESKSWMFARLRRSPVAPQARSS